MLGHYPTAAHRLDALSRAGAELWIKRDDLTSKLYGGNKVRKLELIFAAAAARGARRLFTAGAAGSHHVLATTIYGRRAGFDVAALLTAQPANDHAEQNLRIAIGEGLVAYPAPHMYALPFQWARARQKGDFIVAPGGSSVTGSLGYFAAARELLDQVKDGVLPSPDCIVVALGSGGTTAGLLAGLVSGGYRGVLLGVRIVPPWVSGRFSTLALARAVLNRAIRELGRDERRPLRAALAPRLQIANDYLGRGYGFATTAGERATKLAAEQGLVLEPTYTAKAFAAALDRVTEGGFQRVLFWHTFSSAPVQPLLAGAPSTAELPATLRALLVRTAPPGSHDSCPRPTPRRSR